MQGKKVKVLLGVAACAAWILGFAMLQSGVPKAMGQTTQAEKSTKAKKHKSTKSKGSAARQATESENKVKESAPVKNASAAEIQAAKSNGEVWVNTDSGVYHKSGKWYGATKKGKFMSEQDAVKAGYKQAKNEK